MPETMRAIYQTRYGGPETLSERELPIPQVGPGEVLVRVGASSVNPADVFMMQGRPWALRLVAGLFRPKERVPGMDVAGVVAACGPGATRFAVGDEVFGEIAGAYAEYALAPEDKLALKPKRLSMEDAAALPLAGLTALLGLRDTARVQPGQRVLINGASGGVGSFAVQIAHALGAEVSAVCSARNAERMRAIGADHVIDYARTDFTREAGRYDVIFDLVGSRGVRACLRALSAGGVYIASVGRLSWVLRAALLSLFARGRIKVLAASANAADLEALAELAESGACAPLIDQRYTLSQVPDALRRQSEGHSMGKSTVRVSEGAG